MSGSIFVVIGPPCAGKSSYIDRRAKAGQPKIDFDKIAAALGSRTEHNAEGSIRFVAFSARQAGINRIINGIDDDAWIIHTNPPEDLVFEYKDAGAQFLLVDPGIDVCLARAKTRPNGTAQAVRDWYASPPAVVAEAQKVKTPPTAEEKHMQKQYRSSADWAEDQSRPWKKKWMEIELEASAAEAEGFRGEATALRQKAAKIKKHIERYEALA